MKDCVSLEIAKKLKEAGWPQAEARQLDGGYIFRSSYYYAPYSGDAEIWPCFHSVEWREILKDNNIEDFVACPSIGELLEATGLVELKRLNNGNYRAWNHKNDHEPEGPGVENPADALALLWMALKEKNLV